MSKGFTIIEILLGLAIMAITVTIVVLSFAKINEKQALDKSVLLVTSVLDLARTKTLAGEGALRYGVKLEEDQVVLLPTYATTTLNSLVGVRNVNLNGGGNTIYFERLTGETNQSGSFEIYLKNATTTYKTVNVNQNGLAE